MKQLTEIVLSDPTIQECTQPIASNEDGEQKGVQLSEKQKTPKKVAIKKTSKKSRLNCNRLLSLTYLHLLQKKILTPDGLCQIKKYNHGEKIPYQNLSGRKLEHFSRELIKHLQNHEPQLIMSLIECKNKEKYLQGTKCFLGKKKAIELTLEEKQQAFETAKGIFTGQSPQKEQQKNPISQQQSKEEELEQEMEELEETENIVQIKLEEVEEIKNIPQIDLKQEEKFKEENEDEEQKTQEIYNKFQQQQQQQLYQQQQQFFFYENQNYPYLQQQQQEPQTKLEEQSFFLSPFMVEPEDDPKIQEEIQQQKSASEEWVDQYLKKQEKTVFDSLLTQNSIN